MPAPARRETSNQNGSGKSRMRFESGPNCQVPAAKKSAWKAAKAASNEIAKNAASRMAPAPTPPAAVSSSRPRRARAFRSRRPAMARTIRATTSMARRARTSPPTSRMWLRSAASRIGVLPFRLSPKSPLRTRSASMGAVTRSTPAWSDSSDGATPKRSCSNETNHGLKRRSGPLSRIASPAAITKRRLLAAGARFMAAWCGGWSGAGGESA